VAPRRTRFPNLPVTGARRRSALGAGRPVTTALCTLAATILLAIGTIAPVGAGADERGTSRLVGASQSQTSAPSTPSVPAYWLVASDGGIFSFGGLGFYGSTGGMPLNRPVVGMASTPDSKGYWLVASDGGIFNYGDAKFYGSTGAITLNRPVVAMAPTANGAGYWLVASDGGIFAYANAQFYGSMGGKPLNRPIVSIAVTPDGLGYWLVASDGGIFAYGDAQFYGSTGNLTLNEPIVGMAPTPDGHGYVMVASDGGVFSYGDAQFYGSLGGAALKRPVVAMSMDPKGNGYWFTDDNGAVSAFGQAGYYGSAPQVINEPIVGMAEGTGTGMFAGSPFQSGSYGYDVSVYQCTNLPPSPHTIGVVEVDGDGTTFANPNPCLSSEASWAGAGLNLYDFLYFGNAATGPGACQGDLACNFGFQQAEAVYGWAQTAGVNTQVTWWLDVEQPATFWSPSLPENAQVVQGAIIGLRAEGINNVGVYSSPGVWNTVVGNFQPAVPYWMAWYTGSGPSNCANASQWESTKLLPTGPVVLTQYSDNVGGFDGDYAC